MAGGEVAEPVAMSESTVVSNASPIIALHQVGQLSILSQLFTQIRVPPAVVSEVSRELKEWPDWLITIAGGETPGTRVLNTTLGPGESEAIDLAVLLNASWICLDDRPA